MSELIYPHGKRSTSDHNARAIRNFQNQVSSLIRTANLSPMQRQDPRMIDREVELVFVHQKATVEQRLNYWRQNQMSTDTMVWIGEQRKEEEIRRSEMQYQINAALRGYIPEGYELTQADLAYITPYAIARTGWAEDMVNFQAWAGTVLAPRLRQQARIVKEAAVSREESRQRSIELVNQSFKRPPSEW